jgi:hypothetical protein
MSSSMESFIDRKEKLKGEGKIELPLNIDTNRYLIWKISAKDLLIISPAVILSAIIVWIIYKSGNLNQNTFLLSTIPAVILGGFRTISHSVRKNIKFLDYGVMWKVKFWSRKKQFYYTKGEIDMANNPEDTRTQLDIKNVYGGCYETTDNRLVKVLEVSSINLSLMNNAESNQIFNSYRTFTNEMLITKKYQISQIAQPVNLSKHLLYIEDETRSQANMNRAKRELAKSYRKYTEKTQKSRNMVSRKRYIIFDQKIGTDKEKALKDIEQKATIVKTSIQNMTMSGEKLTAKELNNDDLIKLQYTCLDYDNSLAIGNRIVQRANNKSGISLGEKSAREIVDQLQKQLDESIT